MPYTVSHHWNETTLDLLRTLAVQVTLLDEKAIAETWWADARSPLKKARPRLRELVSAGLLDTYLVDVHPLLAMPTPVLDRGPDDPWPHVPGVAWQLRRRWTPVVVTRRVYQASNVTAALFGAFHRGTPRLHQQTHDVHLGAVLLKYRRERPADAARWVGEHAFPKGGYRVKDPDAFLLDQDGIPEVVVDHGGSYSSTKITELLQYADGRNPFHRKLGLQIW